MNFKTDFLLEDYSGLCWFQTKLVSTAMSVALSLAIGATVSVMTNMLIGIIVFVALTPAIYFLRKRGVMKRAERRFCAFPTSSELSIEISDEDILQHSNSGETRLPWEDVHAVRESEECYYVFLTQRKAFYFPKRSFESEEQRKEFLGYISEHVDAKKVKLKKQEN